MPTNRPNKHRRLRFRGTAVQACGLFVSIFLSGCADLGEPVSSKTAQPAPPPISYENFILPTVTANCALDNCHGPGFYTSGFVPTVYDSLLRGGIQTQAAGLVGVTPFDTAQSVVYRKLTPNPPFGSRMPFGGVLPQTTIDSIAQWILEGALESAP